MAFLWKYLLGNDYWAAVDPNSNLLIEDHFRRSVGRCQVHMSCFRGYVILDASQLNVHVGNALIRLSRTGY